MAATSTLNPELITTRGRCDDVIQDIISSGRPVAVDAEGVNLGKIGPLTLLQIGTDTGAVYLFDIFTNKALLKGGPLKELLSSDKIMKIMHSCRGDSTALYHQFNITLKNVFDTQMAHLIIKEAEGSRGKQAAKLAVLCEMYGDKNSMYEGKENVKMQWNMVAGYWAERPLSREMIEYAAGDVLVLFSIHEKQIGILQEKNLLAKFRVEVDEEIFADIKAEVREKRHKSLVEEWMTLVKEIDEKCKSETCCELSDLNEEELWALDVCRTDTISTFSPIFLNLRRERFVHFLSETEAKIKEHPASYDVPHYMYGKLITNEQFYKGTEAESKAKALLALLKKVQGDNIRRKFKADTPLEYIKESDQKYIRYIRLEDETPNIIGLFERIVYADLEEVRQKLDNDPINLKIPEGQYKKIRFLVSRRVKCGAPLKSLCKRLLDKLDDPHYKGVVQRTSSNKR